MLIGKRESAQTIAKRIQKRRDSAGFYHMVFFHGQVGEALSDSQKAAVEEYIEKHFKYWWDSWIAPDLEDIISKGAKKETV